MENAQEIRQEVLRFFSDQHEEKDTSNQSPISDQDSTYDNSEKKFLVESSRYSINNLDQATKFLDFQLINLGKSYFIAIGTLI